MGVSTGAAILGGSAIAGGLGLVGAKMSSDAAGRASRRQREASLVGTQLQLDFLREVRADIADAVEQGLVDLDTAFDSVIADFGEYEPLRDYINLIKDPEAMARRPSRDYFYRRGLEAMESARSRQVGGGVSGPSMLALQEYGQNYASNALDAELERIKPLIQIRTGTEMGRGEALANYRLAGATGSGNIAASMLPNIASGIYRGGDAAAGKHINQANIWSSALAGIGNQASSLLNLSALRPDLFSRAGANTGAGQFGV